MGKTGLRKVGLWLSLKLTRVVLRPFELVYGRMWRNLEMWVWKVLLWSCLSSPCSPYSCLEWDVYFVPLL